MSFVLDALKKAERERLEQQSTLPGAGHRPPQQGRSRIKIFVVMLVLINVGLVGYLSLRSLIPAQPVAQQQTAGQAVPVALKMRMAQMDITSHIWARRPTDRFLLVGKTLMREGDILIEGLQIQTITESGLTVLYEGRVYPFSIAELWPDLASAL